MDDEMFSVLTEGLSQEGPKAAELKPIPVAPIGRPTETVAVPKQAIVIGAVVLAILVLGYFLFRPKRAITVIAEKAQYNSLFDAPFSSLPGPLMKMPADHLRPTAYGAGEAAAPHEQPEALPVLVAPDDIVPVNGPIPIWGDESVTEKAEARIDEGSIDIKRLIAERESFSSALEREMADALKTQGAARSAQATD